MVESQEPSLPLVKGEGIRVQKILAARGFGSRRFVEDLIRQRRVMVNGQIVGLGSRVDPGTDDIEVDGARVATAPDLVYYLLNKPTGVVSTASDTHGRKTVVELIPNQPRVYPVGRLDQQTEGLLLLTNDGELTHRLTHPSYGVEKEYVIELDSPASRSDLRAWREGVELDDGLTAPAKASLLAPKVARLVIHEGRNRQVRRMCEARGLGVVRLIRIRIGPLADRELAPGAWRHLELREIRALEKVTASPGSGSR